VSGAGAETRGMAENRHPVRFVLNGVPVEVDTDPGRPLLDVLRDDLDLIGTKKGCDYEGQCGACTVLLDGKAARACRTPLHAVADRSVTTIEGVALGDAMHPLQQAFIDCGAVQCGYCTPGMIMAALGLLKQNPLPTRTEVARALTGNLCRCTGYVKIIDAVMAAAAAMRGDASPVPGPRPEVIGGDTRRWEELDKVTGRVRFAGDLRLPGMLYGRLVRSPHARARILRIDASQALRVAGVEAVMTAADIPGVKGFTDVWTPVGDQTSGEHPGLAYEPVLAAGIVRMVGDPVALVVASSEAVAREGAIRVRVDYEPLAPLERVDLALEPGAPQLHQTGNLYEVGEIRVGDWEAASERTEVTVETTYESTLRDHAAIEPGSALAYVDEEGRVVVMAPTHEPHMRQGQIAQMLGLSPDQVRVVVPPLGGSFGRRHHHWLAVTAALPAWLLRRPVRITFSREEDLLADWKQHPFRFDYRLGATRDGRLTTLWARGMGDAGPYGGAPAIAPFVALCGSGPYVWPAIDNQVRVVHTNNPNAGSIRGYGMPQGVFAVECSLDELAGALQMDPWELRAKNAAQQVACTGQPFDDPFGYLAVLEAIRPDWTKALETVRDKNLRSDAEERWGAGIASNWYQFGKAGELRVSAEAELTSAGRITLYYSAMKSGQGLETTMTQLAAHEMGLPRSLFDPVNGDTAQTVDSHIHGACRSTYWVGGAIVQACRALGRAMRAVAAETLNVREETLSLTADGLAPRSADGRGVTLAQIAASMAQAGRALRYRGTFDLEDRYDRENRPRYLGQFSVGTAVATVSVQLRTGKVRTRQLVLAQDVGRVINLTDLTGQLEGAAVMDVGAALMEEYVPGRTLGFGAYRIPRAPDAPEIKVIPVEVPSQHGPHGCKGVGETGTGHVRAALINAIYHAIGARVRRIPASPQRVMAALAEARDSQRTAIKRGPS